MDTMVVGGLYFVLRLLGIKLWTLMEIILPVGSIEPSSDSWRVDTRPRDVTIPGELLFCS